MDVHFSMDKPGWRIHAALKQGALFEGSPGAVPGPTRPGCISLVTLQTPSMAFALRVRLREFKIAPGDFVFVQAKKVTRPQAKQGISESEELSENHPYRYLMKYPG